MFISDCAGGSDCLNRFFEKGIGTGSARHWIYSGWLNRNDGFERLEQFSDGEHELIDNEV